MFSYVNNSVSTLKPYKNTCIHLQGDDGGMVMCQDPTSKVWTLNGLLNFPKFQQCTATTTNFISITDLRNTDVWNWVTSTVNAL